MSDLFLNCEFDTDLSAAPTRPIFWSKSLNAWVLTRHVEIEVVLKSKCFNVVDHVSDIQSISDRINHSFEASKFALSHVPLALENDAHKAMRALLAKRLTKTSKQALQAFDLAVAQHIEILKTAGEIDLCENFFQPISEAFVTAIARFETKPLLDKNITASQVFDRFMSFNRRKKVNAQIASMTASQCPVDGVGLALNILGADALLGTLQESFIHHIRNNPKKSLSNIDWARAYSRTGVPYAERFAIQDCFINGIPIKSGQRVRLLLSEAMLQSDFEPDQSHQPLDRYKPNQLDIAFGGGRHTCLGKNVSIQAWQILTRYLSTVHQKVNVIQTSYRDNDHVFNCLNFLKVEVYEPS